MPHLVRKDYKCNKVLGHWQLSASLGSPPWACRIRQYIFLGEAERTNCKIHPVPHKQSQQSDGEGTACGIGMLTQAFHIWNEEEEECISRETKIASNLTHFLPPGSWLRARDLSSSSIYACSFKLISLWGKEKLLRRDSMFITTHRHTHKSEKCAQSVLNKGN